MEQQQHAYKEPHSPSILKHHHPVASPRSSPPREHLPHVLRPDPVNEAPICTYLSGASSRKHSESEKSVHSVHSMHSVRSSHSIKLVAEKPTSPHYDLPPIERVHTFVQYTPYELVRQPLHATAPPATPPPQIITPPPRIMSPPNLLTTPSPPPSTPIVIPPTPLSPASSQSTKLHKPQPKKRSGYADAEVQTEHPIQKEPLIETPGTSFDKDVEKLKSLAAAVDPDPLPPPSPKPVSIKQ